MSEDSFDCERFLALDDNEVIKYAEPFVTTKADSIPASSFERLSSKLNELSHVQLVYALEICMRISPEKFAVRAADFLSHPDASVCCTAGRLLESLQDNAISDELLAKVVDAPVVDLFALHVVSGERICVGTNKALIRGVLARLGGDLRAGEQ